MDFFLPFGSRVDVYVDTAGRIDLDKIPDSWKKNHLTKSKELRFVTFMKIPFRFHCCSECIIPGRIASSPGSGQQVEHDAPAPRGCQATSSQDEICICTLWIYPRVVHESLQTFRIWEASAWICIASVTRVAECVIVDFNVCNAQRWRDRQNGYRTFSRTAKGKWQRKVKQFGGGTQGPVRRGPGWPSRAMLRRGSPCVCTWHHGPLWKGSVAAASRLCSPSAILWLHRPSTVWAGRFTQALTAWDTHVSTLIVSPFIHDERLHHTLQR